MVLLSSIHNPTLTPPRPSPQPHFVSRANQLKRYISLDSAIFLSTTSDYFPPPVPNLELHSAAASGNVGLVHYALTHGQPVNSVLHGVLPLHAACSGGSVSVVRMLIENGADVNAPRLPRRYSDGKKGTAPSVGTAGSTPLHFAAANGHAPIVQMLLASGANPTKPDKNGNTPEDLAAINGHEDVVRVLHAYHHLRSQDTPNDPPHSDTAGTSSPSGSTSQLPDDEEGSVKYAWVGSRKGKEKAPSLASSRSESALRVKGSFDRLWRRGSRYSAGSTDHQESGGLVVNDSLGSEVSLYDPGSSGLPHIATTSDFSSMVDLDQLHSPVDLDIPPSPSPQKESDAILTRVDSDHSGQISPASLSRIASGHSSHSNGTSIILGSPPNSAGLPPPQRGRINSTSSHRPTLPSILEKAVHPGQAFRAAMRHNSHKDQGSPDSSTDTHDHETSPPHSGGGGFFRGRRKTHESVPSHQKKHGNRHGFKGFFRRGQSPPSRSPSPPQKTDIKPIAAEELEEGIERLKRASLDLERQEEVEAIDDHGISREILDAISLHDGDDTPYFHQMPLSAPVTKTKFFPDSPNGPPRLPSISTASTPGERTFNRPRTGSEVIAPSPLANEWAHDDDSDSSAPHGGIRRVKTEIIKSPILPDRETDTPSPTPLGHFRRRSATHSGGLPTPTMSPIPRSLNPPRIAGLGWGDEMDLRRIAASGLIRRESQRRQAEVDNEMELEEEEYHDALSPDMDFMQSDIGQQEKEDEDTTPTPHSEMTLEGPSDVQEQEEQKSEQEEVSAPEQEEVLNAEEGQEKEGPNRKRGESTGSINTASSRLSTPSASLRNDDSEDARHPQRPNNLSIIIAPPLPVMSVVDGRPRGKSVSSISSGTSGFGYSYAQSISTPATSLTPPSALSLALAGGSGFPPVPEDEVAPSAPVPRRTLTSRTVSSHAEAREVIKQNEDDILHLAQLPPSLDSSRSLAEQLAAYGENYAIERQFAEIERKSSYGLTSASTGQSRSEDGESYFSAESGTSKGSSRSSGLADRRRPSGKSVQPRALSNPNIPLVHVDAPPSSLPSINNIYDKRAEAYRKHMAALSSAQPLLPSSTRHAHTRARQRAVSAQEMWLDQGPSASYSHRRPASSQGATANSIFSYNTVNEPEYEHSSEGMRYPHHPAQFPFTTNPVTGQRPRKSSFGANSASSSIIHGHGGHHSRNSTYPRQNSKFTLPPAPIADIVSTRFQGLSSSPKSNPMSSASSASGVATSTANAITAGGHGHGHAHTHTHAHGHGPGHGHNNPLGVSPYVSIFSNRYQPKFPLNDDDSDDEMDNNREYTVIENDWRGGHIVKPGELSVAAVAATSEPKTKGRWVKKMSKGLGRK
ncbi:uncharacterized protein IL334_004719 [Kwoniella shivajii]|uniref:Ankyrin repeat protein n=1 Tax=Kwoniella shivajii TaxID=564305 RepID=A0ABZ1D151_9TREE|nr:hypothetical protein IL334_004719 [Kwoniella shivajii]